MSRIVQAAGGFGVLLVGCVLLAGCGGSSASSGSSRSVGAVADCLNAQGFLVQASGSSIQGSAPSGVTLTLTEKGGTWTLVTSFGPAAEPLAKSERAELVTCLKKGPAPGTLTAPAAR